MNSDVQIFIEGVVAILLIVAIVVSFTLAWDKRVESQRYYRVKYIQGKFKGRVSQLMTRSEAAKNASLFGGHVIYDKPKRNEKRS